MRVKKILIAAALVVLSAYSVFAGPAAGVQADRVLIEKKAHRLTLYSAGKEIKSYKVSIGIGGMAKKAREGDKLTPEGLYRVDKRNPESSYHLALHTSYPNAADIAAAAKAGVNPGSDIMIHGLKNGYGWFGPLHRLFDWTLGCVAVTNAEIEEIWRLVPDNTEVEIRP